MQYPRQASPIEEIAVRGLTWALIGMIFGFIFAVLAEIQGTYLPGPLGQLAAIAAAAALTALFYGSMRLTVLVANLTFIATLVYTWKGSAIFGLEPLVLIGAAIGVLVGATYGWKDKRSRVFCADAKVLAGAAAGVLGGALVLGLEAVIGQLEGAWRAMVLAPLATSIYIALAPWFVRRCRTLLPPILDGALVGLGVGGVTGVLFMVMVGTFAPEMIPSAPLQALVQRVEQAWPGIVVGCSLVCFPVGVARALLKRPWYDL